MTQLYRSLSRAFSIPRGIGRGGAALTPIAAPELPQLWWPDGSPCWEGNAYLLNRLTRSRVSLRNRGGSLRDSAKLISHFLRFCHRNRCALVEVTDAQFTLFIRGLGAERDHKHPSERVRSDNHVIRIGRCALDFLGFLESIFCDARIVAPGGAIAVAMKTVVAQVNGKHRVRLVKDHHSFPSPSAVLRGLPIATEVIDRLIEANMQRRSSPLTRRRRFIMIRLLDALGARRMELAEMRVGHVRAAVSSGQIQLLTLKKGGSKSSYRFVPVSDADVSLLVDYIDTSLGPLFDELGLALSDDSPLLVCERTGGGIAPDTITTEISELRRHARISGRAHAHAFRHRFVTRIFVWLVQRHHFRNADDARRALLSSETIRRQVMEWTGHTSMASLDRYLHLALAEISAFTRDLAALDLWREADAIHAEIVQLRTQPQEDPSALQRAIELLERLEKRYRGLSAFDRA